MSGRRLVFVKVMSGASDRSSWVFCDTSASNAPPEEDGAVDEERDGAGGNGTAPVVEDTDKKSNTLTASPSVGHRTAYRFNCSVSCSTSSAVVMLRAFA